MAAGAQLEMRPSTLPVWRREVGGCATKMAVPPYATQPKVPRCAMVHGGGSTLRDAWRLASALQMCEPIEFRLTVEVVTIHNYGRYALRECVFTVENHTCYVTIYVALFF